MSCLKMMTLLLICTATARGERDLDISRSSYKQNVLSLLQGENQGGIQSISDDSLTSNKDCHPWMFRNKTSGECECSDIPYQAVLCDPTVPRTSILDCYCMTYNLERNKTELGRCLFGCGHKIDIIYNILPQNRSALNDYTCGKSNRDTPLCGACKPGFSPLVYSYELSCMNCTGMSYNWIKYIAVAYIPLTCFFLFVVIVRFSGTHPLVRGFISVCQSFVSPLCLRVYMASAKHKTYSDLFLKVVCTLYGVWNLDFFRLVLPPICLNISPLQALVLDYAIAFYPLLLVVLTYFLIFLHSRDVSIVVCLWKPFYKVFGSIKHSDRDLEGSVVKAFATFFSLSYLKILNVTFDLLVSTDKYTLPLSEQAYSIKPVLYYDGSVEYFSGSHLYFGIAAIVVGTFFVILPLLFLVIYPMRWFQKCLNFFHIQRQSIDTFVNCYQGYYKDGTNGTRDYRCFSITYFLLQLIMLGLYTLSKSIYCSTLLALTATLFLFIILVIQPYKEQFKFYNVIDGFMFFLISAVFILIVAADEADTKAAYFSTGTYIAFGLICLAPLMYFVALSIWWIFTRRSFKHKLPCFQGVEHSNVHPQEFADLSDREENTSNYEAQAVSLLQGQERNPQHEVKYGAILSSN